MQDKNETAALVRRLGGAAAVARMLDISRQAVHRWVENDQISDTYLHPVLKLCIDDQLPVKQPQLLAYIEDLKRGNISLMAEK